MVPKKHWGTFLVNVVACFALGLVLALNETCSASTGIALLMGVGFFGSLSTFSTFAVELLNELRVGQALTALVLALASIGAGLLACFGLRTGDPCPRPNRACNWNCRSCCLLGWALCPEPCCAGSWLSIWAIRTFW